MLLHRGAERVRKDHAVPYFVRTCFSGCRDLHGGVQLFTSSVEEEVAFGLQQMDLPEAEVRERTEKYLSLLELSALRTRAPWALSGGEKKRCALAAVLAMEPSVYILDEPISGLDEEGQEWITRFLLSLKSPEHTLIIASHSRDFAERIADIRIRMDRNHQIPAL